MKCMTECWSKIGIAEDALQQCLKGVVHVSKNFSEKRCSLGLGVSTGVFNNGAVFGMKAIGFIPLVFHKSPSNSSSSVPTQTLRVRFQSPLLRCPKGHW